MQVAGKNLLQTNKGQKCHSNFMDATTALCGLGCVCAAEWGGNFNLNKSIECTLNEGREQL